jgi:hypothetical protein
MEELVVRWNMSGFRVPCLCDKIFILFVVQSGNEWTVLMLPGGGKDLATAASISTLKEEPNAENVKTEETIGDFYLFFLNY